MNDLLNFEPYILDQNNREIRVGDTLKVFHFTGARRKKYYMYHYVIREESYSHGTFLIVSHLTNGNTNSTYNLKKTNQKREDIEIVQGFGVGRSDKESRRHKSFTDKEFIFLEDRTKINIDTPSKS